MSRYDNHKEYRTAMAFEAEYVGDDMGTIRVEKVDETEVVCLECGAKFSAEEPDECEMCGSADLDVQ